MSAMITAATGETITLFADRYNAQPKGGQKDAREDPENFILRYAEHPEKMQGRAVCYAAEYGGKEIVPAMNAKDEIVFTVESGKRTLWLYFVIGNSVYTVARVVRKLADGSTHTLVDRVLPGSHGTAISVEGIP